MSSYEWIVFLSCALIGLNSALLGNFLILRRQALIGDMHGHSALAGIAMAYMLFQDNNNPLLNSLGAIAATFLAQQVYTALQSNRRIKSETAMAITLSGFYALGIALSTLIQRESPNLGHKVESFLLGQVAFLDIQHLYFALFLAIASITVVGVFYKQIRIAIFDPIFAQSQNLSPDFTLKLMDIFVLLAVFNALQAVGIILACALLIIPAACAQILSNNLAKRILFSLGIGSAFSVAGAFISSSSLAPPAGPSIISLMSLGFVLILFLKRLRRSDAH